MGVMLTLICHAPTGAVRDAAFPLDEALDAPGRAKAAALASTVRRVDAAWTSPARRAMETAAALGIEAGVEPALREIDYGGWSGRTLEEVAAADPAGVATWLADPEAAPHGGESLAGLFGRVTHWLDGVGAQEGRVVAVTHAAIVRAAVIHALDAPRQSFWRIDAGPLARLRLRGHAGRWTLVSLSV